MDVFWLAINLAVLAATSVVEIVVPPEPPKMERGLQEELMRPAPPVEEVQSNDAY
jgi:hypothetical protein